jgi:glycosyltransferase involved in cell wall biosynthesis
VTAPLAAPADPRDDSGPMADAGPVLSIVIPALNEEAAIGSTIERALAARARIVAESPAAGVEILVVNDGSSDRTEAIARSYPEVTVIGFDRNRGYGAAIKMGFSIARGEWVGFLDADGTCDPAFFANLCRAIERERADVALGSRMGAGSEMPLVRTIGNTLFALLLGVLSRQRIQDTASGMRVIRRAVLPDLDPLPDGLHYTPAMTARVLLEGKLKLVEEPMPYAERVGDSKLSVAKDGIRFLVSIVRAAAIYRPARLLLLLAGLFGLGAALLGSGPSLFWLRRHVLEEWMIYRVMAALLLGTGAALFTSAAVVADQIAAIAHGRPASRTGVTGFVSRLFGRRVAIGTAAALFLAAVAVSWPGVVEYVTTAHVHMHWSRVMLSSLLTVLALAIATTLFLTEIIDLIRAQRSAQPPVRPPDRVRPAATNPPSRAAGARAGWRRRRPPPCAPRGSKW